MYKIYETLQANKRIEQALYLLFAITLFMTKTQDQSRVWLWCVLNILYIMKRDNLVYRPKTVLFLAWLLTLFNVSNVFYFSTIGPIASRLYLLCLVISTLFSIVSTVLIFGKEIRSENRVLLSMNSRVSTQ